jgi:tryptophan halogenase
MLGQRITPASYHRAVDWLPDADLQRYIAQVEQFVGSCVAAMPTH